MLIRCFLLLAVLFLLNACGNDTQTSVEHNHTPEEVVLLWQSLMDRNAFAEAKKYSTPNTINVIESFEHYFVGGDESLQDTTIIINLKCYTKGDKSICHYAFEEDGESYQDSFLLTRISGRWLIDVEESELLNDGGLDDFFENVQDVFEEDRVAPQDE